MEEKDSLSMVARVCGISSMLTGFGTLIQCDCVPSDILSVTESVRGKMIIGCIVAEGNVMQR